MPATPTPHNHRMVVTNQGICKACDEELVTMPNEELAKQIQSTLQIAGAFGIPTPHLSPVHQHNNTDPQAFCQYCSAPTPEQLIAVPAAETSVKPMGLTLYPTDPTASRHEDWMRIAEESIAAVEYLSGAITKAIEAFGHPLLTEKKD